MNKILENEPAKITASITPIFEILLPSGNGYKSDLVAVNHEFKKNELTKIIADLAAMKK
jgi:hypothetical protein